MPSSTRVARPFHVIFSALLLVSVTACGGGGGGSTASIPATPASTTGSTAIADSTGSATTAIDIIPSDAASTTPAATATTTAAMPTANAAEAAATAGTATSSTTANASAVGTSRALAATSTLDVGGVPETPTPATRTTTSTSGRTFYIDSVAGNDAWDGRSAAAAGSSGPWRTLARLLASDLSAGDAVQLACGSSWRETLRPPASGTAARPIVIAAASGCSTMPAIDGAVAIAASSWVQHSGNVWKAALAQAPLAVHAASGLFTEAHHPNRGSVAGDATTPYLALAADGNTVTVNGQQGSNVLTTGSDLVVPAGAAITAGTRIRVRTGSWLIDETTIAAVNGSRLTLSTPTTYPVPAGLGYLLLGQLWMVDSAGEWFYDAQRQQLYAWMPDSAAPAAAVYASVLAAGVDLGGRSYITIDGVAVRHTGTGVLMRSGTGVRLQNSVVEDIADVGIDAAASSAATIESNVIRRVGLDAVSGHDDSAGAASGMAVRNNLISDAGVVMKLETVLSVPRRARGAIVAGSNATVSGNAIINAGYIGIRPMSGSTVEDNFVFGACTVLDDCGAIHMWHEGSSVIRRNTLVHMRGAAAGKPAGQRSTQAQGIYLDDATTNVLVENNTVVDADNGVQIHVAWNNTIRNNRLYGNRISQIWMQDGATTSRATGDVYGNTITGNQIAAVLPASVGVLMQTPYASTSAFGSFDGNRYFDRGSSVVAVASTAASAATYTLAQWQQAALVGSTQAVETSGSSVSAKGYAAYTAAGNNLVANSGYTANANGWYAWNAIAPAGQLVREACAAGFCLHYVPGGSAGLLISPNFSLVQGQWYRLTMDLKADTDGQAVQIIVRRGGGGSNGYETLSDRNLAAAAGTSFGRYAMVFQATQTVVANNPATGDLGARVDIAGLETGKSVSVANMELVPISVDATTGASAAVVNAGTAAMSAACPFTATLPSMCSKLYNLADDTAANWPLAVPARSAVVLYAQERALVDSDGDGIADAQDRCPGTARGASVNAAGCSFSQR